MFVSTFVALTLAAPSLGARLDLGVTFPISSPQVTYFNPGPGLALTGELGILPFLDLELQLSYLLLPKTAASPTEGDGTLLNIGAGARVRRPLTSDAAVIPWGELLLNYGFSGGSRFPLTLSGGVQFRPVRKVGLLVGPYLRLNHVFAVATPEVGYTSHDATLLSVGIAVEYLHVASSDLDGDGIDDSDDKCPEERGPSATQGCPDPNADTDDDGIVNSKDACPTEAEDPDGYQDDDGCPEQETHKDTDNDGVFDKEDECPKVAGPKALRGCPDKDSDGIPDHQDACPTAPGNASERGCPKYKQLVVTETKIEIKQKIYFAFALTQILPKSDPLLEEVAQALKDRPQLCVRIEGHTDNKGSRQANQVLSQGRAESVRDFLTSHGIEDRRLKPVGYADTLPLDDNSTPEGRENNRRVEFVIVDCSETR